MSFYVIGLLLAVVIARTLPETRPQGTVRKRFCLSSFAAIMGNRTGSALLAIGFASTKWGQKIPACNGRYAESEENEHHTFILT
ncbi:hypothetical protein LQV63_03640 [Paenibacillus profundus]|uniref:Uncharacterized protein n=1 Tax=Paenibacillus profundus TaxID=1173085 RepID=A0ABS8YA92_9BACL|nr:hypothetical protein [Paenibacillus profundus]MCE5168406.1 hypothetical protein [Paenibacillus profundus]